MPTIVFISYNMFPYLHRPDLKISGGAELQLATLARLLLGQGFRVVFLSGDFGQAERVEEDGFTFYKIEVNGTGKLNKLKHFGQLLRSIRPDYLLERGTSTFTFPGVLLSRVLGIPYIFCGASDVNFARNEMDPFFGGSRWKQRMYQWALPRVRHFVVQKKGQAALLEKNYGITRNVTLIRNFPPAIPAPASDASPLPDYDAIWVANLIPYKQPEMFIELARRYPRYRFLLVGGSPDKAYQEEVLARARQVSNLTTTGYLPPAEVIHWMRRARIAVNTTQVASGFEEGFSNVQLMGWMCGLPSIALISDPDNLIVDHRMGFRSGSFEQLCADFEKLAGDQRLYGEMSGNALCYVREHHHPDQLLERYLDVLRLYRKGAGPVT